MTVVAESTRSHRACAKHYQLIAVQMSRMIKILAAISIALIVLPVFADDADDAKKKNPVEVGWPFVRGAGFDNRSTETGLAESWPKKGPPVLWTRPLGAGYSSFTAINNRVFTQYQGLGGQYVICLNARNGKTIWEHRYDWPYETAGLYPGPRSTPTLANGRVYFSGPNGHVGCLDQDDGDVIWSVNIFERFKVEPVEFGYSCSPTILQGKVLLPVGVPNASMVALDADTGTTVWQAGDAPVSHVPAMPLQVQGRWLVIGYLRNNLVAFDLKDGQIVWQMPISSGYDEHAAWPIYEEPYLWVSGPFRTGAQLLNLKSSGDPKVIRKNRLMSNDVASSVLVDGFIYGFDLKDVQSKVHRPSRGQFRCVSLLTGEEQWSNGSPNERRFLTEDPDEPSVEKSIGHASVLYADGKLILFNDTGDLILAKATPKRFEQLGRIRVLEGEIVWTQPTLYKRHLFLRNHSRVVCLYLGRPELLKSNPNQPTLTVADIPQAKYRDWAAIVLPVEPEYAMDAPSVPALTQWFWVTTTIGFSAVLLISLLCGIVWRIRRRRPSAATFCWSAWSLTFLSGACGTTVLGLWFNEFLFTWPLCLFVVLQATVYHTRMGDSEHSATVLDTPSTTEKRPQTTSTDSATHVETIPKLLNDAPGVWLGRFVLLIFLVTCVSYFLICRRFSLAFNWIFLSGFVTAAPILAVARLLSHRVRFGRAVEVFLNIGAFAAFYWTSVGFLLWKYPRT
jgi:hypothetical protein